MMQANVAVHDEQSPCSPREGLHVSFGLVNVREYKQVLEAHPSCSDGPGIGLEWDYISKESSSVDAWESAKRQEEKNMEELRRITLHQSSRARLVLSKAEREIIAKKNGFTDEDIQINTRTIQRASTRRFKTLYEDAAEKQKLAEQQSAEKRTRRSIQKKNKRQKFKSMGVALSA